MKDHETSNLEAQVEANLNPAIGIGGGELQFAQDGDLETALAGKSVTDDEKKRIFRERARRLAKKRDMDTEIDEDSVHVIEFLLGSERYAVDVGFVREVYTLRDLTPVPCTPPYVLGIVNVRGQVVSVADMKVLFDLPRKAIDSSSRVLILNGHGMEMGILVDSVLGELRIPVEMIQSQMPAPKSIRQEYVRGVTQNRLVLLDAERILSDDRIIVHEEVGE